LAYGLWLDGNSAGLTIEIEVVKGPCFHALWFRRAVGDLINVITKKNHYLHPIFFVDGLLTGLGTKPNLDLWNSLKIGVLSSNH